MVPKRIIDTTDPDTKMEFDTKLEIGQLPPDCVLSLYVGDNYEGGMIFLTAEQVRGIRDYLDEVLKEVKE